LKVLDISDPRETLPTILATLPGSLQKSINTVIALRSGAAMPGGGPPGGAPGNPTIPGYGGPTGAGGSGGSGDSSRPNVPMAPGIPGGSGSGGNLAPAGQQGQLSMRGAPGAPGAPGGANPAGGPTTFSFQIDASKVPSAESIKSLLFPSIFTIEVKDDEITITTREAFPSLPDPSKAGALSTVLPAMMGAGGGLPPGLFPPPGGAPPGAAPGIPGGAPPGAGAGRRRP
jgi:hypothetical protein